MFWVPALTVFLSRRWRCQRLCCPAWERSLGKWFSRGSDRGRWQMTLLREATWEAAGKACSSLGVMEDPAGHQHLFRHRKGSFIQKALRVWQGALQSVAFLLCVIVMQISRQSHPGWKQEYWPCRPRGALAETQPWGLQCCLDAWACGEQVYSFNRWREDDSLKSKNI